MFGITKTEKAPQVAKVTQVAKTIDKSEKIIELVGVTKVFNNNFTAVDNINLSIKKGEFVTLLGPSGCGKTTLLRMIAGFEMPTSGQIFLEKYDVTNIPPNKRNVNTVFQRYALFPHLNVFNNVAFGLKLRLYPVFQEGITSYKKLTRAAIVDKVNRALTMVGLEGYGHRDVNSLSGGQQQRVAIARALVLEPRVLLLDEPLGALDLKMRKEMQIELKKMHRNLGITFVYVTHDQEEALTMSDRIMVINNGEIQQIGTPKQIYDEPSNAFVADFIGESNILSGTMIQDFKVSFCGETFVCEDKGFEKNEKVDLVIRPEDITIDNKTGQLEGTVIDITFKGTYYEMEIKASDYEFTVQSTEGKNLGETVRLNIAPNAIHIMKKMRTVNEFVTIMTSESTVEIAGGDFEVINTLGLLKGDPVRVRIAFDKIELTDDENDGTIGGNITQSLYKGSYYQVQLFTDTDEDIYLDTIYEWDNNDRVGINIKPEDIILEKIELTYVSDGEVNYAYEKQ